METVLTAVTLLIGAVAKSAQAQTTNSTQTRPGTSVVSGSTSGMGSGTITNSRATRAYPADSATTNSIDTKQHEQKSTMKLEKNGN